MTDDTTGLFGDINIELGTKGAAVPPPVGPNPDLNETNGGSINFFGNTLSAKGAINLISANKADVNIANSIGVKSISLGGGLFIGASSQ